MCGWTASDTDLLRCAGPKTAVVGHGVLYTVFRVKCVCHWRHRIYGGKLFLSCRRNSRRQAVTVYCEQCDRGWRYHGIQNRISRTVLPKTVGATLFLYSAARDYGHSEYAVVGHNLGYGMPLPVAVPEDRLTLHYSHRCAGEADNVARHIFSLFRDADTDIHATPVNGLPVCFRQFGDNLLLLEHLLAGIEA